MQRIHVRLPSLPAGHHDVVIGSGLSQHLTDYLRQRGGWSKIGLCADDTVARLHGDALQHALGRAGIRADLLTFPAGEASKTRDRKALLEDEFLRRGYGRDSLLLALGGGVTIDLAGFTAATFMRGIPFVALPTTILAMVDSSLGGKTAVDTDAGKNLIGAFHPPAAVFADLRWLDSLPEADFAAGFAEAVKHGLIAAMDHLEFLELNAARILAREPLPLEKAIAASVAIKARFVEMDEREAGARKALNFGHTFAHALERLTGWSLRHGEAVARGLVAEALLSQELVHLGADGPARIRRVLGLYGLPTGPFDGLEPMFTPAPAGSLRSEDYLVATRADKKARAGRVEYVLLAGIGAVARDPLRDGAWSWPVEDASIRRVLFGGSS